MPASWSLLPQRLRGLGLESLLLDADCTLKRYRSQECAPGVAEWLDTLRQAGFGLCLVSNGLGERIGRFAEPLGLPFVAKALKPLPARLPPSHAKNGFSSREHGHGGGPAFCRHPGGPVGRADDLLVEPIHPEEEPWFTRLKRGPERWLL